MKKWTIFVAILALAGMPALRAGEEKRGKGSSAGKKAAIDAMARESLTKQFNENGGAEKLHAKAYGNAVIDNPKVALGISGGGGLGVAVGRVSGKRTHTKMGTGGVGVATYQITEKGLMAQADIAGTKFWKDEDLNK